MASASVSMAIRVKLGDFNNIRAPYRKSCNTISNDQTFHITRLLLLQSPAILAILRRLFAPNTRRFMPEARCAACRRSRSQCIVSGEMSNRTLKEGAEGRRLLKRRIVVVVVPPVEELDLVGPVQVLSAANRLARKKVYSIEIITNARDLTVEGEGGVLSFLAQGRLQDVKGKIDRSEERRVGKECRSRVCRR